MGRDDDGEPILLVDEDSRRRRANYSRGNFSVTSSPQQRGHKGSLDQAFASGSPAVVPESTLVRDVIADRWCYIGASTGPEDPASKAPTYTLYPQSHPSDKLQ